MAMTAAIRGYFTRVDGVCFNSLQGVQPPCTERPASLASFASRASYLLCSRPNALEPRSVGDAGGPQESAEYGYIYYDGQTFEASGSSVLKKQVERLRQLQHQRELELATTREGATAKLAPKQQDGPDRGLQPVPEVHKEGSSQGSAGSGLHDMSAMPDKSLAMLQGGLQVPVALDAAPSTKTSSPRNSIINSSGDLQHSLPVSPRRAASIARARAAQHSVDSATSDLQAVHHQNIRLAVPRPPAAAGLRIITEIEPSYSPAQSPIPSGNITQRTQGWRPWSPASGHNARHITSAASTASGMSAINLQAFGQTSPAASSAGAVATSNCSFASASYLPESLALPLRSGTAVAFSAVIKQGIAPVPATTSPQAARLIPAAMTVRLSDMEDSDMPAHQTLSHRLKVWSSAVAGAWKVDPLQACLSILPGKTHCYVDRSPLKQRTHMGCSPFAASPLTEIARRRSAASAVSSSNINRGQAAGNSPVSKGSSGLSHPISTPFGPKAGALTTVATLVCHSPVGAYATNNERRKLPKKQANCSRDRLQELCSNPVGQAVGAVQPNRSHSYSVGPSQYVATNHCKGEVVHLRTHSATTTSSTTPSLTSPRNHRGPSRLSVCASASNIQTSLTAASELPMPPSTSASQFIMPARSASSAGLHAMMGRVMSANAMCSPMHRKVIRNTLRMASATNMRRPHSVINLEALGSELVQRRGPNKVAEQRQESNTCASQGEATGQSLLQRPVPLNAQGPRQQQKISPRAMRQLQFADYSDGPPAAPPAATCAEACSATAAWAPTSINVQCGAAEFDAQGRLVGAQQIRSGDPIVTAHKSPADSSREAHVAPAPATEGMGKLPAQRYAPLSEQGAAAAAAARQRADARANARAAIAAVAAARSSRDPSAVALKPEHVHIRV